MIRALAVVVPLVATGCKVSATFHCAESTQCGAGGTCEDNTLCSFPDPGCASGASYGDYSGDLSGVCVGDEPAADADIPDARVDAALGDPCLEWTFLPAEFDPCAIPVPTDPNGVEIVAGTWTLVGDNGTLTDGTTMIVVDHITIADVAVVSVDHLVVASGATLRVVGSDPVAIAAWSTIQIDGTVEVNSSLDAPGAGAGSPACVNGPLPGQPSGPGDGGSGGAGFGGSGGSGGNGDGDTQGGPGGATRTVPARIEGGCDGADNLQGDRGGPGGGGIALIAKSALTVGGVVHAGGAGGSGAAPTRAGGAGGGSGGMIKLESRAVAVGSSATLAANGGQGGGGSQNLAATDGVDGQPNQNSADSSNGEGEGSRGGRGGARSNPAGANAPDANAGGGGGGGGVGYIVHRGHDTTSLDPSATYSPPAMPF